MASFWRRAIHFAIVLFILTKLLNVYVFDRTAGLLRYENRVTLYASPVTDTLGPPVRFGSRNEMTVLELGPEFRIICENTIFCA